MTAESKNFIEEWREVPSLISSAIASLSDEELDLAAGNEGWTIRETVHHLVEANLIACSMIIAALGSSGCTYDWSWLVPDRKWMKRLGYQKLPVGPALELLRALTEHISTLLIATSADTDLEVRRLGAPGAEPEPATIKEILKEETEHVQDHLGDVRQALEQHLNKSRPLKR
jgi:hypothetical protein